VASDRAQGWAKYLYKSNIYPVVITRNWNIGQKDSADRLSSNKLSVEHNETYEVHRVPYYRSFRDKLVSWQSVFRPIQRFLTVVEIVFSCFTIRALPYYNIYFYAKNLIAKDADIKVVICSGSPFQTFFFGHLLKRCYPRLLWIPDYRDEWTSFQIKKVDFLNRFLNLLKKRSEHVWTSNAIFFTSVSSGTVNSISNHIGIEGHCILNGFEERDFLELNLTKNSVSSDVFNIGYLGTIYQYQDFSILIKSIKKLASLNYMVRLNLIGSYISDSEKNVIESMFEEIREFVVITQRTQKKEALELLATMDSCVLINYMQVKGVMPVKMYEYYRLSKPILLIPSDNDTMSSFIKETNSGYTLDNFDECFKCLKNLLEEKRSGVSRDSYINYEQQKTYSREYQANLLGELINRHL
jgi:hypothetical protein